MFPGIDPAKIKGKRFKTLVIDIQVIKDGKIRRSWHFEDFGTALAQVCKCSYEIDWKQFLLITTSQLDFQ